MYVIENKIINIIYYKHLNYIQFETSECHKPFVRQEACQFGAFWVLVLPDLSHSEPRKEKETFILIVFSINSKVCLRCGQTLLQAINYFFPRIIYKPTEIRIQLVAVCEVKTCEQLMKNGAKLPLCTFHS